MYTILNDSTSIPPQIKQPHHKFYLRNHQNNPKPLITFKHLHNNQIHIHHTPLSHQLPPQPLPKKLLNPLVQHAPQNNLKIIPSSPFPKNLLQKHHHPQHVYL
ncbi:N-acetyltransferase, partial [Staphylococcus epidermidis]|uniref:N-acetyltransferase n=1 Tax=Staphylococcus epidermidis TaxID=1282 RepID=UPI0028CB3C54